MSPGTHYNTIAWKYPFVTGDSILSAPSTPPVVWGDGEEILWAEGQSLIIAGHDGTGKTTLAGNLVRARLGIAPGNVLGFPVTPGKRNVLYFYDGPAHAGHVESQADVHRRR